ncbi:hypothetical protein HYS90_02450 [Candidatus Curtissbacteria bacterium]|nr:hypothetical protein [Candidatus Curtissbacteria bacterium]
MISLSATYNAILLRGGKLAWSQVLIVLAMVSFMLSLLLARFLASQIVFGIVSLSDVLFVLGFVLLLAASIKLHVSLK